MHATSLFLDWKKWRSKRIIHSFLASESRSVLCIFPWILRYLKKCLHFKCAIVFFCFCLQGLKQYAICITFETGIRFRQFPNGNLCLFVHFIGVKFSVFFLYFLRPVDLLTFFFISITIPNEGSWFKAFFFSQIPAIRLPETFSILTGQYRMHNNEKGHYDLWIIKSTRNPFGLGRISVA